MSKCYFCDETSVLEEHHIVPRRFDGSDDEKNIVEVCPTCHSKLESLYDKRFYDKLGVDTPTGSGGGECVGCGTVTTNQVFNGAMVESFWMCEECYVKSGYSQ